MMNVDALQKYLVKNGLSIRALARMYQESENNYNSKLANDVLTQAQVVHLVELLRIEDWQEVFFPTLVIADTKRELNKLTQQSDPEKENEK